jgi:hypothetical protein
MDMCNFPDFYQLASMHFAPKVKKGDKVEGAEVHKKEFEFGFFC